MKRRKEKGIVAIKRLTDDAKLPTKGTKDSACYDLYANEDVIVPSDAHRTIGTGIAIDPGIYHGIISHRSGLNSNSGIQAYGTVDRDYRGEIKVCLFNNSACCLRLPKGSRIAQIRFVYVPEVDLIEADELYIDTERGANGHGSTGT